MKSPFPGMDPYLEDPAYWQGFHAKLINYLHEAIAQRLPRSYRAEIKESIRVVDVEVGTGTRVEPDINIAKNNRSPRELASATVLTLQPILVELEEIEERTEWTIAILRHPDKRLVTAVEVLSPTNKGSGSDDYVLKRRQLLAQRINLVEIDLLVGGLRPPLNQPWPDGDYHCLVARGHRRRQGEVLSWTVQQTIPPIPIPLESPDPDIVVPLAEVFSMTYERGLYFEELPYHRPPLAPLAPDDLRWATEIGATVKVED